MTWDEIEKYFATSVVEEWACVDYPENVKFHVSEIINKKENDFIYNVVYLNMSYDNICFDSVNRYCNISPGEESLKMNFINNQFILIKPKSIANFSTQMFSSTIKKDGDDITNIINPTEAAKFASEKFADEVDLSAHKLKFVYSSYLNNMFSLTVRPTWQFICKDNISNNNMIVYVDALNGDCCYYNVESGDQLIENY